MFEKATKRGTDAIIKRMMEKKIDPEECIGCGLCVITWLADARNMKMVRPPSHIPEPGDLPYATT